MRAPRTAETSTGEPSPAPKRLKRAKRNPEIEVPFGARIRAARIAAHMSQGALGEAVGISFQQVQKYELGKDRVAVSTLQAIATALGMHPGSFFDNEMPIPAGPMPDVKAALKSAYVLGRVRDPRVLKQLLALAKVLGEADDEQIDGPANADDGTP